MPKKLVRMVHQPDIDTAVRMGKRKSVGQATLTGERHLIVYFAISKKADGEKGRGRRLVGLNPRVIECIH